MKIRYCLGVIRAELYFRGARTLKDRRGHLRSLKDRLSRMGFSVAQVGPPDMVQQAWIMAVTVSGSRGGVEVRLDRAEELLLKPDWELAALEKDIIGDNEKLQDWEIE
ncbi:MAG: DUF503 family protein [Candidatus Aegiribacteria sp.]